MCYQGSGYSIKIHWLNGSMLKLFSTKPKRFKQPKVLNSLKQLFFYWIKTSFIVKVLPNPLFYPWIYLLCTKKYYIWVNFILVTKNNVFVSFIKCALFYWSLFKLKRIFELEIQIHSSYSIKFDKLCYKETVPADVDI